MKLRSRKGSPEAGDGKPRRRSKPVSDRGYFNFDLMYQLSYLSVIAGARVPRSQIFKRAAQLSGGPAEYFRRVERTRSALGCDYAKSCRIVGEAAGQDDMKALLLRLSSSLVSGEPEADFMFREADARLSLFNNQYERDLESLKQWTDAYVSLIISAVVIIIIGVLSSMVWKLATSVILGLMGLSVGVTVLGAWLIYLLSPREIVVGRPIGSREQKLVRKLLMVFLPLAVVVAVLLFVTGTNIGWIFMAVGVVLFPIGFVSNADDKKVTKRDAEIGPFVRSLGGAAAAIGTTVRDALGRLDLGAINVLKPEVRRLNTRLRSGIRPRLCWQKFVEETGSEVAKRSVTMFYDVVEMGGEPEEAGYRASLYASKLAMLRAKRKTVSFPFRWLSIAMHAAVSALLVFIFEVVATFGQMVGKAQASMPDLESTPMATSFNTFNYSGIDVMQHMIVPLVLIFTVSNALAPSVADGGSRCKFFYNLAINAVISGVWLATLPGMANMLFESVQR